MAVRVIGGSARGQRLTAPRGDATRPTADRVREALFSSLAEHLEGARILDLYAGSGALGIEALSRGAASAVLVEKDARAAAVVTANLTRTGLADKASVLREPAARVCAAPPGEPFDLVFLDPPYTEPVARVFALLTALYAAGGLASSAITVLERDGHAGDLEAEPPAWLALDRRRSYGDTVLLYYTTRFPGGP